MISPDGKHHPLGFYSAHLTPTQQKYSTFKKELLGAHKSLRHFLPEVYGKHVTILTDCLPLQQAFNSTNIPLNDPQTFRQITEISQFTRDVQHVSGLSNIWADLLSRPPVEKKGTAYLELDDGEILPTPVGEVGATESLRMQVMSMPVLKELQENCEEIKKIRGGNLPRNTTFNNRVIDNMEIFCETTSGDRPYVPKPLRQQIILAQHSLDHVGITPTVKRIASDYYWPSLKNDKWQKMRPVYESQAGEEVGEHRGLSSSGQQVQARHGRRGGAPTPQSGL